MSEQPLFDIDALRKINAQPGDVFVLELSENYDTPTAEEAERVSEKIRSFLGDVKVMVLPPGCRLEKLPFAFVSYQEVPDATPTQLKELEAAVQKAYAENSPQAMMLPPGARLEKQPDANKLADLLNRVSDHLFTSNADMGLYSEVMGAILELRGLAKPQSLAVQWRGNMPSVVRVEEPAPSLKEANEQHAVEAADIVKKALAQPGEQGGYAVPREVALHAIESGVLPPDAILPVEPQADGPHKITWKEWL